MERVKFPFSIPPPPMIISRLVTIPFLGVTSQGLTNQAAKEPLGLAKKWNRFAYTGDFQHSNPQNQNGQPDCAWLV